MSAAGVSEVLQCNRGGYFHDDGKYFWLANNPSRQHEKSAVVLCGGGAISENIYSFLMRDVTSVNVKCTLEGSEEEDQHGT